MRSRTAFSAPLPRAIMAMTAATPITMPSIVSSDRSLLARSAANATRTTSPVVPNTMRQFLFQILVEVKLDAGRGLGNPGKCDSSTPELIGVSRGGMGAVLLPRRRHPRGEHVHEQARRAGVNRGELGVECERRVDEHPAP